LLEAMGMDSLGSEVGVFVIPLWLSVVLSAYAAVVFFCVRSESVPRIGWALRFGPLSWGPPEPVARPLVRGYWVVGLIVLGVLAIIQVQPAVWISQASGSARNGLIGLSAVFYLLELGWWVWLWRLPREKVHSALPQDRETRDRVLADEVAQFDAAYRAREIRGR
jgi:hypothetical protein